MKLNGVFEFVGIQDIQGKKDTTKTYHNVVLMQDSDVVKVFLNDETLSLFDGVKKMEKLNCELSVNVGSERSYINVLSVKKVAA